MAFRWLAASLLLVASTASAAKVALVVEGAGDRTEELATALRRQLTAGGDEWVDAGAPTTPIDDAAAAALRARLVVERLVIATLQRQGKDRWLVTVRAFDANPSSTAPAIERRFGDATSETFVDGVGKVVAQLPPLASPKPAAPPATAAATAKPDEAPPAATVETPPEPAPAPPHESSTETAHKPRKREYGLLIGGIVAFVVPWMATVGLAAHYQDYNANAARLGYIPMVGPLLAKQRINDHDLGNGYDVGLSVDGAIQIVATAVLVAGILYAAIGVPNREHAHESRLRPLFGAGARNASLGLQVSW